MDYSRNIISVRLFLHCCILGITFAINEDNGGSTTAKIAGLAHSSNLPPPINHTSLDDARDDIIYHNIGGGIISTTETSSYSSTSSSTMPAQPLQLMTRDRVVNSVRLPVPVKPTNSENIRNNSVRIPPVKPTNNENIGSNASAPLLINNPPPPHRLDQDYLLMDENVGINKGNAVVIPENKYIADQEYSQEEIVTLINDSESGYEYKAGFLINETESDFINSVSSMAQTTANNLTTDETTISEYITVEDYLVSPRNPSDEEKLLNFLLTGYKPSARPVMNSSHTVPVQIQFSLMHIKDLDVKSQILTTTGLLILDWQDERLTWIPSEHNNLNEIIIEIKGLWRPEFAVINGAENIYEEYDQFRAVINNEGHVHWEPGGVFKTMCEIDITYYPFDDQRCKLTFGAWSYHTAKMNLTNTFDMINLDSYNENGEWNIINTNVKRNEFSYKEAPGEKFANIDFTVYLRRRHTFYVLNVILPSIMTSVLLLSVFFCTPAQKVQIGVVVLLSFRIFLLNVADNIPKTSDHIPLLGIYLTCTMAITTLSMVLTVFVLNLHHISERPIPSWARSVLFIGLARIMGMCSTANALAGHAKPPTLRKSSLMGDMFRKSSGVTDKEEQTAIFELQNRNTMGSTGDTNSHTVVMNRMPSELHQRRGKTLSPTDIKTKRFSKEKPEDFSKDWKKIAEIFDRLFFWLFLLAIVISTLILFHPLTKQVRITNDT